MTDLFLFWDPSVRNRTEDRRILRGLTVQYVEILDGLKPGDRVILSDSNQWDEHEGIRLE